MITERTFKLIKLLTQIGYWTGIFPFQWNSTTYTFVIMPKANLYLWKIYTCCTIIIQWILITIILLPLFTNDNIRQADRIMIVWVFLISAFTLSFQIFNILLVDEMVQVLNIVYLFYKATR